MASLRSARGRLLFFVLASVVIFVLPIQILSHFSIWGFIGFDQAPSIGLTRAYHYVLHADFSAAWHRNRLIFVILLVGLPLLAKDGYNVINTFNKRKYHGSATTS